MCELFGASFNKQAGIKFAFKNFRERGESHPDGWGLAWYPDGKSSQIIKEAKSADTSQMSNFLTTQNTLKSKIFISHVRSATGTAHIHSNTHPFSKTLRRREYVFAHNGFESPPGAFKREFSLKSYFPLGETDSEIAFCHLMDFFKESSQRLENEIDFAVLSKKLYLMNQHGKLNLIFSDGEYLFCYHTNNQSSNSLKYVRRSAPFGHVKYKDSEQEFSLSETKDRSQKGYIVSTKAQSDEEWIDFAPGQLIVFKDGEIVFS